MRCAVPVVFIFYQCQTFIRFQLLYDVRSSSDHFSILCNARFHINDTAIRIRQVIHQCRNRFTGCDRQCLTVRFNIADFQVTCRTFMDCHQIVQTFFNCLRIHFSSAGKCHIIAQSDRPCIFICIFIRLCQPWLQFHRI